MKTFTSMLALVVAYATAFTSPALARETGTIGIAIPTESSARPDRQSTVEQFGVAGHATDLRYAEDDIPNQLARIENIPGGVGKTCSLVLEDTIRRSHVTNRKKV